MGTLSHRRVAAEGHRARLLPLTLVRRRKYTKYSRRAFAKCPTKKIGKSGLERRRSRFARATVLAFFRGSRTVAEVKIDGVEYLMMKESDIMRVLVEVEAKKKAA